jgi:hypothetical protein
LSRHIIDVTLSVDISNYAIADASKTAEFHES